MGWFGQQRKTFFDQQPHRLVIVRQSFSRARGQEVTEVLNPRGK